MNDFVLPCKLEVDIRGVDAVGKGKVLVIFEVRVMVDGVRVVGVKSGGNTNNVWDGVDKPDGACFVVLVGKGTFRNFRRWGGG